MALNAETLGNELYDAANNYNDTDIENLELARRNFWKAIATAVITHFKVNGELKVPGAGLVAPNGAVTGNSVTGKIE